MALMLPVFPKVTFSLSFIRPTIFGPRQDIIPGWFQKRLSLILRISSFDLQLTSLSVDPTAYFTPIAGSKGPWTILRLDEAGATRHVSGTATTFGPSGPHSRAL